VSQIPHLAVVRQARPDPLHNPEQRSFTSWKLDLIDLLLADPRHSPTEKNVAICILQHVNQKNLRAWPSIETISDKTCIGWRHVARAIKALQQTGWLRVRRGNRQFANEYRFQEANTNQILDRLTILREGRESQKRLKKRVSEMTRESCQKGSEMTWESSPEMTPESYQHLRRTPQRRRDSQ
jgi:AraC-like DNA-binding protein